MLSKSLIGSSCTLRNARTPESTPVPSGKPIWQAGKIQILLEQIKPINKRFSTDLHCIPLLQLFDIVCLLGDGKWSRTRPEVVVRSANALSRDAPVVTMSLSTFQWTTLTLNTPFMSTFPCLYLRTAQFAAPVADHFGRKQFCIRHCFMVKASQWENTRISRVPAIGFHHTSWAIET